MECESASRGSSCPRAFICFGLFFLEVEFAGSFTLVAMLAELMHSIERTSPSTVTLHIFILLAVIACSTRFISGRSYTSNSSLDGTSGDGRKAATFLYWFPYLGHLLPLIVNPDGFLQSCWCVLRMAFPSE